MDPLLTVVIVSPTGASPTCLNPVAIYPTSPVYKYFVGDSLGLKAPTSKDSPVVPFAINFRLDLEGKDPSNTRT